MCGLVGVSLSDGQTEAAEYAINLLVRLQHRGQDGAGLSVWYDTREFQTTRGLGLIDVALRDWRNLSASNVALAHTRYATTGTGGVSELQPFVKGAPKLALAHNGNIVNTLELTKKFGLLLDTASDLDVLQQVFLRRLSTDGFEAAVNEIFDEFNGSYAVVGIEEDGTLFGFRDPFGIRPLFYAHNSQGHFLASETCALSILDDATIKEIAPGEWIRVSKGIVSRGKLKSSRNPQDRKRYCMFENVYFSSPQSEVGGRSIYRLRFRLGAILAREILAGIKGVMSGREAFDFVVPVPDTSRSAALAVAEALGIPYREFLVKNNYIPRTFILGRQDQRLKALSQKLSLIGPEIKGFRILLVDDSVVRGNTSRMMAARLREAGAKSVSLGSTCPPIRFGCFYGIDFPDANELVANERDLSAIGKQLNVDSLFYISQAGLLEAFESENYCMACLDGKYPTEDESFKSFLSSRRSQRALNKALD